MERNDIDLSEYPVALHVLPKTKDLSLPIEIRKLKHTFAVCICCDMTGLVCHGECTALPSGLYLDMKVTKTVNGGTAQEITDVSAVLEIELSYNLAGKYNPVIVREHEGKAMQFGRLSSKPSSEFKDGTFYVGSDAHP